MMHQTKIGNVAEVIGGSGFNAKYQGKSNLPIPFIKVSDFARSKDDWLDSAANSIDEATLKEIGARKLPVGTIIFPKVGGALLTNKRARLLRPSVVDNNIMGLIPRDIMLTTFSASCAISTWRGSQIRKLFLCQCRRYGASCDSNPDSA